jgi:hypothetical protein
VSIKIVQGKTTEEYKRKSNIKQYDILLNKRILIPGLQRENAAAPLRLHPGNDWLVAHLHRVYIYPYSHCTLCQEPNGQVLSKM